jgi:pimeloyl-ACP methyl ester carboxylesterase
MHLADESASRQHRETVVLLHSSGASARQWDALADALDARFDVHALDLHGHGRRPGWAGARPLSIHDDAAIALDILARTGGGHVIGHSYGAAVAVHVAAAQPWRVRSLALYEPVLFRLLADHAPELPAAHEAAALGRLICASVAQGRMADAAEHFVDYWSGSGTWARMGPERRHAVARRMPSVAAHFDALNAAALPPAALARLTMPLLCLHGTRSTPVAVAIAALLRMLLPAGRHEALAGLGHMAPLIDAPIVNTRLLRFLRDATARTEPALAATA